MNLCVTCMVVLQAGQFFVSGTVLLSHTLPLPARCQSAPDLRPPDHVHTWPPPPRPAVTDRRLGREENVAGRGCRGQGGVEVLTGLQGVLKAGAAVGRGGAPRGVRRGPPRVQATPGLLVPEVGRGIAAGTPSAYAGGGLLTWGQILDIFPLQCDILANITYL